MTGTLFLILTFVVLLAGFLVRRRTRRAVRRGSLAGDELLRSILDDEEIRALDDDGEPLDEDAIRRAEDEFWAEEEWSDDDDWRG